MESLRRAKDFLRSRAYRAVEKYLRLHVTPVHYYSPIPDLGDIKPETYTRASECMGLDFAVDRQLSQLESAFPPLVREYAPPVNSGLAQVDTFVLYAMIRMRKPALMIEIGSGESTKISLAALRKNESEGAPGRLIAIEPYPLPFLRELSDPNLQLIVSKVQDINLQVFRNADILFIDSSHVAKIGSDVNFEMLEILPQLKVGAVVHWHDIMIPMDYSREWIESGTKFWNESYMVHTFMLYNKSFNVLWASRFMQVNYPDRLRSVFPYFNPQDSDQQLSSFWIQRVS